MSYLYSTPVNFAFGSFDWFCSRLGLTVCPLVGPTGGVEPQCYSRNIEIGNTLIFEPSVIVIHLISLIMTVIMIAHVRSKYTAVGRKEILVFFYLYVLTTFVELLTVGGIIPLSSPVFPYAVAIYIALTVCTFWCLFVNALVPFQFVEDGTPLSLWSVRISTFVVFLASLFISIATLTNVAGFTSATPGALWVTYFVIPPILVLLYSIFQIVLVVRTLEDNWAITDIAFGLFFFVAAHVTNFFLSPPICDLAKHYLDGMFFGNIFTLLAVMMVYKYWDGITKEDLEFAVGGKNHTWEVRDPLLNDAAMAQLSKNYGSTR
ncbi:chitin synthase III catalytic subunit [Gorgonomyces haynaldii]|nr:chitin synthase III catalytic subunit [Gorgonomyces haynaldii]